MFLFIDVFFLVIFTNNVDEFGEFSCEFSVIILMLGHKFVNLLEKTFVWSTGNRADETTKTTFLPRHETPLVRPSSKVFSQLDRCLHSPPFAGLNDCDG